MTRSWLTIACWLAIVGIAIPVAAEPTKPAEEAIDFNRDIRPILSNHCFQCHGPDAEQRESGLRLDLREAALQPAESGMAAIVPGKADESELIARIFAEDESVRMPPADSNKQLTAEQKELLRRWVAAGAAYQQHWAYQKPSKPEPPQVKNADWAKNEIDRFILARLEQEGLSPSPEADRVTLIRRLYFDLLGLPPSPEEVDQFVNDQDPQAYEKLVDRVLRSPAFGERMAIFWLDLVRFADTGGYHSDNHRDISLYRDYVIAAFNNNKPFDQFTIEQLAGDLIEKPTRDSLIASGYNRLLMTTEEGGAQAKEYTAKYQADRVRNASVVWLGATMGCAECHDHKFDPFTAKDFYSFAAFFADIKEKAVGRQEQTPMPTESQQAELARLDEQIAQLQQAMRQETPELIAAQAAWEQHAREQKTDWVTLTPTEVKSAHGTELKILDDGTILAAGARPERDTYTITVSPTLQGITAFRLEVLPDDAFPNKGPGRADNGNFVLHEIELKAADQTVKWSTITATHSQNGWAAENVGDGKPDTGWAILPQTGKPNELVLETSGNVGTDGKNQLVFTLAQNYGSGHAIGKLRLSATALPRPIRAGGSGLPQKIRETLAVEPGNRNDQQKRELAEYYRGIAPLLQPQRDQLAKLQQQKDELLKAAPTTLISMSVAPRTVRILPRGNWLDDSGEIVSPAVPEFLPGLDVHDGRATRLDLARWLVSRENPLVARVFVNRLWKLAFGQGLVKSLGDFGTQGGLPSHPELLDWLSVEFMDGGWDVKGTLRRMVLSNTYRQASRPKADIVAKDPLNLLLARQNRFRIDAEMVRDSALEISGLLVHHLGGPSVKPYQPAGYWQYLNFPKREYQHDHGDNQYRRGLYTYWQRTFPHPSLVAFDAPSREECTVERPRSNTPLQALVLLNDPTYVEAARVFAEKIIRSGGETPEERLEYAFRRALSRPVRPDESKLLTELYAKHRAEYQADLQAAQALIATGEWPVAQDIPAEELAAWTSVARVLLNLHETITRN